MKKTMLFIGLVTVSAVCAEDSKTVSASVAPAATSVAATAPAPVTPASVSPACTSNAAKSWHASYATMFSGLKCPTMQDCKSFCLDNHYFHASVALIVGAYLANKVYGWYKVSKKSTCCSTCMRKKEYQECNDEYDYDVA